MKLNLLPTHVSKEGQSKFAWVIAAAMAIAGIAVGATMVSQSSTALAKATERAKGAQDAYDKCKQTSAMADTIMASSVVIDRNNKLAAAMLAHNTVYPDLYKEVLDHVPSYFRVNSISAVPASETSCTVTMIGVLQTYQQYADIMLAMLRIPGATNVTRAGFTDIRKVVPPLNEQDQIGLSVKPGEANLPSDPMKKLDEMINRAGQGAKGFQNAGGFGTNAAQKGAMPEWSLVTITVTLSRNIMTPVPVATLKAQGAAGASAASAPAAGSRGGGFTPPGAPAGGGSSAPGPKGKAVGNADDN